MERCDFASVTAILRENIMDGSFSNQIEFASALFGGFVQENDFYFDNGLLNRWFNGLAKVSPAIGQYYHDNPEHRHDLTETLRNRILTRMADSTMTVREVHTLLFQDKSVSNEKKEALCGRLCSEDRDDAAFLTDVLIFGIVRRPFVARDIRKTTLFPFETQSALFCVRKDRLCPLHCGNSRENSGAQDVFTERAADILRNSSGMDLCESIMRMVWEVAHLKDWEDFERGLTLLYDMERVFIRNGDHALLIALSGMLRTMSDLRTSVEDTVRTQPEYKKARYIRMVMGDSLHFRFGRGERADCRDYAEPKSNRGPPRGRVRYLLVISFIKQFPGSAGQSVLLNFLSIPAQFPLNDKQSTTVYTVPCG